MGNALRISGCVRSKSSLSGIDLRSYHMLRDKEMDGVVVKLFGFLRNHGFAVNIGLV